MILVDRDIREFIKYAAFTAGDNITVQQTAIFGGDKSSVTNIGYDLSADSFSYNGKMEEKVELQPGESTFVKSREIIAFDAFTVGKVVLKNSRIRMGLTTDAPVYQPGHITNIYFRATNVSNDTIIMSRGEKYVMLMFEKLDNNPEKVYSGTFQKEFSFKGLADYKSTYTDQIQSLDGKVRTINDIEKRIYSNVITIMTVLIAVFSILNLNISLVTSPVSSLNFITYNLATLGAVSFLAVLMDELINHNKSHKRWFIPAACFAVILILLIIEKVFL